MISATCRVERVSFRSVNRRGLPGYDPGLQRHHILPRQLLSRRCFGRMFEAIGTNSVSFDDFRTNGMLLPAKEDTAVRFGLPLHRGPHRAYNQMVIERVGEIEGAWSRTHLDCPQRALLEALDDLSRLQRKLRDRLYEEPGRLILNSNDPLGYGFDFTELDAMAETLYSAR
ncbi:AHH domain-containing protein [Altererythrobacter sp. GH1-8]|uniref:AHH domain-containing protein n=1 Tax=Altererythrobacter sp. GH1-8 TaxID=3349333 RepID=UPI00374CF8E3